MTLDRRKALVAAAVLPAGCAIQPLASLPTAPIPPPHSPEPLRAPRVGHAWRYRKLNFFNSSVLNTHYRLPVGSLRFWIQVAVAARGWERVGVAAGTFDTLRIERLIRLDHQDHTRVETLRQDTLWLSPAVGRWVARDTSGRYRMPGSTGMWRSYAQEDHIRWELTDWQ